MGFPEPRGTSRNSHVEIHVLRQTNEGSGNHKQQRKRILPRVRVYYIALSKSGIFVQLKRTNPLAAVSMNVYLIYLVI